ncbi:MAG: hypothetical protein KDA24_01805 [Deltaproteobacteria bacterium]|nr:hypothetical protein [Deltaproteobacteria bacterium]
MSTLLLSAGERSGDLLGGAVLRSLLQLQPDLSVTGVAGPAMRAAGRDRLQPFADIDQLSGAGLVELVPRLPSILGVRTLLREAIELGQPRAAVLIDAPDLHLPLLARARQAGVRAIQLVAPQFWAWRPGRARRLAEGADCVLCLFRFETQRLEEVGARAVWVGHPVVERAADARAGRRQGRRRLVLLPGSRAHEQARHAEAFVEAAKEATRGLDVQVVLSWPSKRPSPPGVETSDEEGIALLAGADAALVAPGTATLEAAMVDCPTVVAGALHPASAFVARRLLQVDHVALPNLLLGTRRVPEVLQDLSAHRLAPVLRRALDPEARLQARGLREELAEVLGPPGFGDRAARAILENLEMA